MLIETKRRKWILICGFAMLSLIYVQCNADKVIPPEINPVKEKPISTSTDKDTLSEENIEMDLPYQDTVAENSKIDIISSEPDQTSWKIPNVVIHKMGDLEGQTIADIGAGVGYFAFRLVLRDANVIAIDIDPSSIDLMNSIAFLNLDDDQKERFKTRLAKPDDPLLNDNEVDKAILMHLIGFIDDQKGYLTNLKSAIKPGGQLMIMDFKMKRLPDGYPSKEYRIYADKLEQMLYDIGFTQIVIDDTTLDFQYILTAVNPD